MYQGLGIYTTTAQVIQANLKEIGVNATIKLVEWANLMERKNSGSYDAMLYGVSMKVPDPDAYAYYFGAESTYWAKPIGNRDEMLEKLLADGRATTVTAERKAIYRKVEERLLETSPWVFVQLPRTGAGLSPQRQRISAPGRCPQRKQRRHLAAGDMDRLRLSRSSLSLGSIDAGREVASGIPTDQRRQYPAFASRDRIACFHRCERDEAIQYFTAQPLDCFVAFLLAMRRPKQRRLV